MMGSMLLINQLKCQALVELPKLEVDTEVDVATKYDVNLAKETRRLSW